MDISTIYPLVLQASQRNADDPIELSAETSLLRDLGFGSLELASFCLAVFETFDVHFGLNEEELLSFENLGNLVNLLRRRIAEVHLP